MHPAIETLEELNRRWPGFFELIRTKNGYETDLRYADLMRVQLQMDTDEEGMQRFVGAMQLVLRDRSTDPELQRWLEETGFVEKHIVDLKREVDAIANEDFASLTAAERASMAARLDRIRDEAARYRARRESLKERTYLGVRVNTDEH